MTTYLIASLGAISLLALVTALRVTMSYRHSWSRSIFAHLVLIAMFVGLVLLVRGILIGELPELGKGLVSPKAIDTISLLVILFFIAQQFFQLINRLTHSWIAKGNDPTTARMISRLLKCATGLSIFLLSGEHFGIGLSGLLAFGGLGGIALGVAGRDVLSNLFSGLMLYFDRPFGIGDWISSPDRQIEGTVVEIGWRLTNVMTFDNRPLYVPNSLFSEIVVENPGHMKNRRISTTIGLRYQDAARVSQIVDSIRTMLRNDPEIDQTQDLLIYFNEFSEYSLNIMVYCFTRTTRWAEWLSIQQRIFLDIVEIVHSHGADLALPSQTLSIMRVSDPLQPDGVTPGVPDA